MIRAFLAIDLPESYRESLSELLRVLQRHPADVKWVSAANLHLTLKFFGQITPAQVEAIILALKPVTAATAAFNLGLEQVGGFPNLRSPRVIWLGCRGQLDRLTALHDRLSQALVPLGFPPEERPFTPHLTLGRVRSGRGRQELSATLQELKVPELPVFQVEELTLYQSVLKPQGAVYTPLARLPLAGKP